MSYGGSYITRSTECESIVDSRSMQSPKYIIQSSSMSLFHRVVLRIDPVDKTVVTVHVRRSDAGDDLESAHLLQIAQHITVAITEDGPIHIIPDAVIAIPCPVRLRILDLVVIEPISPLMELHQSVSLSYGDRIDPLEIDIHAHFHIHSIHLPHISYMWSQNSSGMRPLSLLSFNAWVPILVPLGAFTWHGDPGLHGGLNRGSGWLVHMSVGFCLKSEYWQNVIVYLGSPSIHGMTLMA